MGAGPSSVLTVHAAGSLRAVFTRLAALYEVGRPVRLELTFGASGLLRERIEDGAPAQVFASADTRQPELLAEHGDWLTPRVFARNRLCALCVPHIAATPDTLLATLLREEVRVGTSTPGSDPAGDYVQAFFRRADAVQPGAGAALQAKARQLTGAATSPKPPPGHYTYAWIMAQGQADVFLTYQTNALQAQRLMPQLRIVSLPPELEVGTAYGLTLRADAPAAARDFVAYLFTPAAQTPLQQLGFGRP
jgi:molybdate transport system substrate-binding protein